MATKINKPYDVNVVSKSADKATQYEPAPTAGMGPTANKDEPLPSVATRGT
jgi:hypothetical protein